MEKKESAGLDLARKARRRSRTTVMMEMRLTRELLPSRPLYKQWTLILKEFGKLLNQYNLSDEFAYWYGERALTGLWAAAAWRIKDGWSIEEFTGLRRTGGRQNSGKGDVWIGIQRKTFTVEAKMVWAQGPHATAIRDARKKLSEAGDQLDSLDTTYQVDVPTAVCYIVPELNLNRGHSKPEAIDQFFTKVPHALKSNKRCTGAFWYKNDPLKPHKDKRYPGVIVVAQFWSPWPKRAIDN
jgi:hypothetical protein